MELVSCQIQTHFCIDGVLLKLQTTNSMTLMYSFKLHSIRKKNLFTKQKDVCMEVYSIFSQQQNGSC